MKLLPSKVTKEKKKYCFIFQHLQTFLRYTECRRVGMNWFYRISTEAAVSPTLCLQPHGMEHLNNGLYIAVMGRICYQVWSNCIFKYFNVSPPVSFNPISLGYLMFSLTVATSTTCLCLYAGVDFLHAFQHIMCNGVIFF